MNSLISFIDRIANWKTLSGLILLYILFVGTLLPKAEKEINTQAGKEVGIIDLTLGYHPERVYQMLADYGDAGRKAYHHAEVTLDLVYPIIYALLFAVSLSMIYRGRLNSRNRMLVLLPFLAMVFDFLENLAIVSMLNLYPQTSMLWANLCELFKLIKFLIFGIIILAIMTGLFLRFLKQMKTLPKNA